MTSIHLYRKNATQPRSSKAPWAAPSNSPSIPTTRVVEQPSLAVTLICQTSIPTRARTWIPILNVSNQVIPSSRIRYPLSQ
ncbi:hypothetical protein K435DRAFT_427352 [Dendrothele bispora CBS 962.96]|uniref:Uncharacterized protein n=1 Tax=Dendrothele bispora (strain CBS 962.96) TaxID=1314807 RepID=A0A4S8MEA0_DENBC|nr:hypothetical protein K435DRAFT_427352 [Dendrothele bispora CBS 962.96]